jgi:hypothetical protein
MLNRRILCRAAAPLSRIAPEAGPDALHISAASCILTAYAAAPGEPAPHLATQFTAG